MLKFFFHHTPNPMKVALFLEETGLDFQLVPVDTLKGDQHTPEFRLINPNGKTPAIEDNGQRVFDSCVFGISRSLIPASRSPQF